MRAIEVDFVTRVKLIGIIGTASAGDGGIEKLHALQRAYEKIRLREDELQHLTVTESVENGSHRTSYTIKDVAAAGGSEFGRLKVVLEDHEATWLLRQVRFWTPNAGVGDLGWLDPLLEKLEATPEKTEPKHIFKRRRNR